MFLWRNKKNYHYFSDEKCAFLKKNENYHTFWMKNKMCFIEEKKKIIITVWMKKVLSYRYKKNYHYYTDEKCALSRAMC